METEDVMDWMLEEAKKNPMEIHHDFNTRFRVWVNQIIPSRLDAIRQCKGDVDYAIRMVKLTLEDAERLCNRACEESVRDEYIINYTVRLEGVLLATIEANKAYLNEVKQ